MSSEGTRPGGVPGSEADASAGGPSEEELRAAYEAELSRITSVDVMLQACVSLLNLGGLRLGPPPGVAPAERGAPAGGPRDLEQARDAIDGVRALLGVLERRLPRELGPLRDALSQLQIAYAREAQGGAGAATSEAARAAPGGAADGRHGQDEPAVKPGAPGAEEASRRPGPAESSGRLWVPGE